MSIFKESDGLEKTEDLYKMAIESKQQCLKIEEYTHNSFMIFVLNDAGRESAEGVDYCILYKVREKRIAFY